MFRVYRRLPHPRLSFLDAGRGRFGSRTSERIWICAGTLAPPMSGRPRVRQVSYPDGTFASPETFTATSDDVPAPTSVAEICTHSLPCEP